MFLMPLLVQTAPPPDRGTADEVVVIGQRLKDWRGRFRMHDGKPQCRTTRSTGDKAVDAIGCDAIIRCYAPLQSKVQAMASQTKDKAERQRRIQELADGQLECLKNTREAGIAKLAEERMQ